MSTVRVRPKHVDAFRTGLFVLAVCFAILTRVTKLPVFDLAALLLVFWGFRYTWPNISWSSEGIRIRNVLTHSIPLEEFGHLAVRTRGIRGISFEALTISGKRRRVWAMFIPRLLLLEDSDATEYRVSVLNEAIRQEREVLDTEAPVEHDSE